MGQMAWLQFGRVFFSIEDTKVRAQRAQRSEQRGYREFF
jgi:hypothetical protein